MGVLNKYQPEHVILNFSMDRLFYGIVLLAYCHRKPKRCTALSSKKKIIAYTYSNSSYAKESREMFS
jgi:hypothetical protein